jgi:hypothetical protein
VSREPAAEVAEFAEFAAIDARVDAVLAALARRQSGDELSFAAPADPAADELAALIAAADDPNADLQFSTDEGGGLFAGLQAEFAEFTRVLWRELTHLAIVETRGDRGALRTSIGWTGDTTCMIAGTVEPARARAHAVAVAVAVAGFTRRLRLLTTLATAAGKIAALVATPGGALAALPVAYKCTRDLYDQWNTTARA